MSDVQAFFHMGGYAAYVWTSFGLTAVVLIANIIQSHWQLSKLRRRATATAEKRTKA